MGVLDVGGTCPSMAKGEWSWEGKEDQREARKGSHRLEVLPSLNKQ